MLGDVTSIITNIFKEEIEKTIQELTKCQGKGKATVHLLENDTE